MPLYFFVCVSQPFSAEACKVDALWSLEFLLALYAYLNGKPPRVFNVLAQFRAIMHEVTYVREDSFRTPRVGGLLRCIFPFQFLAQDSVCAQVSLLSFFGVVLT